MAEATKYMKQKKEVEERFWEAMALSKELGICQEPPRQVGWAPGEKPKESEQ